MAMKVAMKYDIVINYKQKIENLFIRMLVFFHFLHVFHFGYFLYGSKSIIP